MKIPNRVFEDVEAVRQKVPLLIGLVGASGSGKTGSALELSHGIQDVVGGEIYYIDTEARRASHYADMPLFSDKSRKFKFRTINFQAPFSPLDYLAAVEHCVSKGAKTIVIDSLSHEHEGPGGVLEWHEAELDRMAGTDWAKRDKVNMLAWAKPKAARRRLINTLLQMEIQVIACFRAKEKTKIVTGEKPIQMGWQPIAGEEFVFEMMLKCLLYPNSGGIPTWVPNEIGERQMIKLPEQFKSIFAEKKPLSFAIGKQLAEWAQGGVSVQAPTASILPGPIELEKAPDTNTLLRLISLLQAASSEKDLNAKFQEVHKAKKDGQINQDQYSQLELTWREVRDSIRSKQ